MSSKIVVGGALIELSENKTTRIYTIAKVLEMTY
jgi:hypothetical protein